MTAMSAYLDTARRVIRTEIDGLQALAAGLDEVAERIAIDSYREIVQYIGDKDPTTRRIFEDILAQEEEHADDLAGLLDGMN